MAGCLIWTALEEINEIEWGDDQWDRIVWGDFVEREDEILGDWGGRPQFGQRYFDRMMDRYKKRVLIRSHQPLCAALHVQKEVYHDLHLLCLCAGASCSHCGSWKRRLGQQMILCFRKNLEARDDPDDLF